MTYKDNRYYMTEGELEELLQDFVQGRRPDLREITCSSPDHGADGLAWRIDGAEVVISKTKK